ncbi:hypothetical protein P7K49_031261, partial [Saguinus oedipus]
APNPSAFAVLEQITTARGEVATVMNSAMWYQTAAQTTVPSATLMTKMGLQMVLKMENPPSPARSHLDWVQSMVSSLEVLQEGVGGSLLLGAEHGSAASPNRPPRNAVLRGRKGVKKKA